METSCGFLDKMNFLMSFNSLLDLLKGVQQLFIIREGYADHTERVLLAGKTVFSLSSLTALPSNWL